MEGHLLSRNNSLNWTKVHVQLVDLSCYPLLFVLFVTRKSSDTDYSELLIPSLWARKPHGSALAQSWQWNIRSHPLSLWCFNNQTQRLGRRSCRWTRLLWRYTLKDRSMSITMTSIQQTIDNCLNGISLITWHRNALSSVENKCFMDDIIELSEMATLPQPMTLLAYHTLSSTVVCESYKCMTEYQERVALWVDFTRYSLNSIEVS